MHASGTLRFGFSTAPEACAADSMPRNAHSVSVMLEPMPAAANVPASNQNQPKIESRPTGMMTPHTVTAPRRPVRPGPPKLAIEVSHSSTITPMQVATGVDDSHGRNGVR